MTSDPRSTDEAVKALGHAAEALARRTEAPKPPPQAASRLLAAPPVPVPGPKTAMTVRALRWFVIVFWLGWVALVMFAFTPPTLLEMFVACAGAGLACLVWYHFHKAALIGAVGQFDKFRSRRR